MMICFAMTFALVLINSVMGVHKDYLTFNKIVTLICIN
ncbi:hypothetical protein QOS_1093 [Clostridioides difficile Y184]|nr:hypothetical protein QOS_1093 [Clostridioides difficile Y184]